MVEDSPTRPDLKTAPVFKTAQARAAFFAAYDAVLGQWPGTVEVLDVPSAYGTTRVHACGPEDGAPLVLLHGGGATSTVWFANVGELSRTHRVYAVDRIGEPGRSVHDGRPIGALDDLMAWLDAVFVHLGLDHAGLCGHSYGGWLALNYALRSPERVARLVLLDPTECFAGMSLRYRLRAVPLFVRPTAQRMRAFIGWETGGIPIDPAWLELAALGLAGFPSSKIVMPRRPEAGRLRASTVPTLLLLAEKSKSHDIRRVEANARRLMPHVVTAVLPGATHHSVPMENPAQLDRELLKFLS
jgi:pimeloyl-ACP methyl ester carboxylesterase